MARAEIRHIRTGTLIVGSGCAAYNAADWLWELGERDIALMTEGRETGTSRNTGSDKQTYYKLSLCGEEGDSVREMAKTLFDGGSVDGDTALCEAAASVRCFMKLVNYGVPFPTNEYGEYVGYKTDHDPRQRATSTGPLTSKLMTEALERRVLEKGVRIYDGFYVARLVTDGENICGAVALDTANLLDGNFGITVVECRNAILATGGPAGIYRDSVYPPCHTGSTGLALGAGAVCCELQEWQYGLASVKFRWNVSGTYQQVLPRYVSVDREGKEHDFLNEYYADPFLAAYNVFLKGYQWPFDGFKVNGSSAVDLLVYREICEKGNRVFMDFMHDPKGICPQTFSRLPQEAYSYLEKSGALLATPIARLEKMNPKAIALYAAHGIDLKKEYLEVSVCAQHNNGGVEVDANWQSSVQGLYVAGEAAGTFGVYRPGGAALNSTQAGSLRAAEHIVYGPARSLSPRARELCMESAESLAAMLSSCRGKESNVVRRREEMQGRMSRACAYLRKVPDLRDALAQTDRELACFAEETRAASDAEAVQLLKNYDILLTQAAVIRSMIASAQTAGTRGSCLVLDEKRGEETKRGLDKSGKSGIMSERGEAPVPEDASYRGKKLCVACKDGEWKVWHRDVRPIPGADDWFENVWNKFNDRRKIK